VDEVVKALLNEVTDRLLGEDTSDHIVLEARSTRKGPGILAIASDDMAKLRQMQRVLKVLM